MDGVFQLGEYDAMSDQDDNPYPSQAYQLRQPHLDGLDAASSERSGTFRFSTDRLGQVEDAHWMLSFAPSV